MASGFSWGGGRSRCFSHWQEFQKCYAQTDTPAECVPQSEDYLECLHNVKLQKRTQALQTEYKRRLEEYTKEHPQADAGAFFTDLLNVAPAPAPAAAAAAAAKPAETPSK